MKIPKGWYVILDQSELPPPNKIMPLQRFGKNLVLWLDENRNITVLDDHCPHRGAKLSLGKLKNNNIECPFHGFQFDSDGKCKFVPELNRELPNFCTTKYIVRVKERFVWLWLGESEVPAEIPWFSNLDSKFSMSFFKKQWKKHVTRCIENQLDYAHLPFVHSNSIGRYSDPKVKAEFSESEKSINVSFDKNGDSGFELIFPNIWQLRISPKMKLVLAFVPVSETTTDLYLRTYQSFLTLPLLNKIVGFVMNLSNRYILNQDERIVYSQVPENSSDASSEKLFNSDRAILMFREWWKKNSL